jgi:hypothetical protein
MKQSSQRQRLQPRQPLGNPRPTTLWKRLPTPNQQACRQVLSQLLQHILRHEQPQNTVA